MDKAGEGWYQVSIGGSQGVDASLGKVHGPSFAQEEIPDVVEKLIDCYIARREGDEERFVDMVRRIGLEPFKQQIYARMAAPDAVVLA